MYLSLGSQAVSAVPGWVPAPEECANRGQRFLGINQDGTARCGTLAQANVEEFNRVRALAVDNPIGAIQSSVFSIPFCVAAGLSNPSSILNPNGACYLTIALVAGGLAWLFLGKK